MHPGANQQCHRHHIPGSCIHGDFGRSAAWRNTKDKKMNKCRLPAILLVISDTVGHRLVPRCRTSVSQVVHLTWIQQVLELPEHPVKNGSHLIPDQARQWVRRLTEDAGNNKSDTRARWPVYLSPCFPPLFGLTKTSRGWVSGTGTIWDKSPC